MNRTVPFHPDYRDSGLTASTSSTRKDEIDYPPATPYQKSLQRGLITLLVLLMLEGILRKTFHFLSLPIFFAKDFLIFYLGIKAFLGHLPKEGMKFIYIQIALIILLIPCILNTLLLDPVLGAFGIKQYCLFPFVAVAVCGAYLPDQKEALLKLLRFLALSILVTTAVAVAQNRLPPGHWLNVNPDGQSLEGFSAGGYLRVTSTFPFVSQYCIYLNAMPVAIASFYFLRNKLQKRFAISISFCIALCYVIGVFITGSRSSVFGAAGITAAALVMMTLGSGISRVWRLLLILGFCFAGYQLTKVALPEAFGAYEARSQGTATESHFMEVENRVVDDLTHWMAKVKYTSFLGNGLGIQSNGSEKMSSYAAAQKNRWGWMESDSQTALFEGGVYLISTWYPFRILMIIYMAFCVLSIKDPDLATVAAFGWGFVLFTGILGTLSTQPPIAIWWWFYMGIIVCFREYDSKSRPPSATRSWI